MRLEEIEKYAKINNIPIMEQAGIEYLTNYIRDNNITKILEIGTAIGYSAIKMALIDKNIEIVTIERTKDRYEQAIKNIEAFNLNNQIKVIHADALNIEVEGIFDLIFIDAAKSQSIKFFEKYEKNLSSKGTIITDNMNFHGLLYTEKELSKNVRGIVSKIKLYVNWLNDRTDFTTTYLNVGDGIAISKKIIENF